MSNTLKRVKEATAALLKLDPAQIKDDDNFVENIGASSMQSIELVAAFEEEFDIEMDEDEAVKVKTIKDAVTFIDKVIAGQN